MKDEATKVAKPSEADAGIGHEYFRRGEGAAMCQVDSLTYSRF